VNIYLCSNFGELFARVVIQFVDRSSLDVTVVIAELLKEFSIDAVIMHVGLPGNVVGLLVVTSPAVVAVMQSHTHNTGYSCLVSHSFS